MNGQDGCRYLVISDSRPLNDGNRRDRVMIIHEHLRDLADAFQNAVAHARTVATDRERGAAASTRGKEPACAETASIPVENSCNRAKLRMRLQEGADIGILATEIGRKPGAAQSRLRRPGLDMPDW